MESTWRGNHDRVEIFFEQRLECRSDVGFRRVLFRGSDRFRTRIKDRNGFDGIMLQRRLHAVQANPTDTREAKPDCLFHGRG